MISLLQYGFENAAYKNAGFVISDLYVKSAWQFIGI